VLTLAGSTTEGVRVFFDDAAGGSPQCVVVHLTTERARAHGVPMKASAVEWDAANLRHFAEHGRCRRREVEEVLRARCYPARAVDLDRDEGDEPRRLFYGRTCAGRHLAVVAAPRPGDVMRPITCWPLSEKSVQRYEAWRKTVK
jgi:uncharacterized DUF497 family protein